MPVILMSFLRAKNYTTPCVNRYLNKASQQANDQRVNESLP